MSDDLVQRLENYGATREQLVDLTEASPDTLRYLDLVRAREEDRPVLALESQRQPRVYIFKELQSPFDPVPWVRRIAFRGDADYIAVLRPGRLDVYPVVLGASSSPEPLTDLPEGQLRFPTLLQRPAVGESEGVRTELRNLLRRSIEDARRLGKPADVDAHDAISLVGRALFWRFLIDRELLRGLNPAEICKDKGVQSFAECLVTRARALETFDWLDRTFNGSFLQFRTENRASEIPEAVYRQVVGNIAYAATASGQLELPSDWRHVNFAHVPVGLLSEVYEAYAHQEDAKAAEDASIVYTPRHLAEFMVEESLASLEHVDNPRVLDPAAGAGVFLVAVFRALVAREWTRTGSKGGLPSRKAIRRILYKQLTAFDINDGALRLAELALYLTAIELDPHPNPKPLSLLQFEKPLRGTVLHWLGEEPSRGSLGPVDPAYKEQFDLVIGNPPWTAKASIADKSRWADDSRAVVKSRLGKERAEAFTFPDVYPDIPFFYRAMEWARSRGQIALVTHARWLFPGKADEARNDLLQSVQITGILNGTALRDTSVWPNSRAPFVILFARNDKPKSGDAFQFVSPLVSDKDQKKQRLLHVDWNDARIVSVEDAVATPWLLKARFRGTAFDGDIIDRLTGTQLPLTEYLKSLGTEMRAGYRVGNRKHAAEWLRDMPSITPRAEESDEEDEVEPVPVGFWVDPRVLRLCGEDGFERSRSREVYSQPLLLVRQSPPADPSHPRAVVSETDVAFSQSWYGVSFNGIREGLEQGRWLQLLLQSKVFLYFALLTDGGFGVERDRYVLETVEAFPVVPLKSLTAARRRLALKLSAALWKAGWSDALEDRINELVFDTYGLDDIERDSIRDTLATSLPYAKNRIRALSSPEALEIKHFAAVLEEELSHVLEASNERASVRVRADVTTGPWVVLQIDRFAYRYRTPRSQDRDIPWAKIFKEADASGATLVTVNIDRATTFAAILRHYRYWTPTRARMLALSLLERKSS